MAEARSISAYGPARSTVQGSPLEPVELQRMQVYTRRSNLAWDLKGESVWEGVVHVFDLEGHPQATRAYAWSSPVEGSTKRRFFAALHIPPITSPLDAVRAAIVAEQRGRRK